MIQTNQDNIVLAEITTKSNLTIVGIIIEQTATIYKLYQFVSPVKMIALPDHINLNISNQDVVFVPFNTIEKIQKIAIDVTHC